jgi:hypothetical protein
LRLARFAESAARQTQSSATRVHQVKYAALAAAGVRGVGVWTADMVSYLGGAESQATAAAMWRSLDAFTPPATSSAAATAAAEHQPPPAALRTHALGGGDGPRVRRLAQRFRARQGLPPGGEQQQHQHQLAEERGAAATAFIPGYDPCKTKAAPAAAAAAKGCSDGLICISPRPNTPSVAEHESGGCYPVAPRASCAATLRGAAPLVVCVTIGRQADRISLPNSQ